MIIDVDDVKILYKQYGIENNLTDEELEELIQFQFDNVLGQLGVTLEPQIHNYTVYQHPPKKPIVLPLANIQGIDHIMVNGKSLCVEDYFFDDLNGIVHITKNFGCCPLTSVHINYITTLPDVFLEKLKSLILDMLLLVLTPQNEDDGVKSIKEGDVTVTYHDDWGWWNNTSKAIPIKMKELKGLLYNDTVFML